MNPLDLLRLLSPKVWAAGGLALLLAFAGCQTVRLNHAKADQLDKTACLKGQPCKPVKWKAEVISLRQELSAKEQKLGQCEAGLTMLGATIERQNASVAALGAASREASARSTAALAAQRSATATAKQQALQILAAHPGPDACKSADELILGSLKR